MSWTTGTATGRHAHTRAPARPRAVTAEAEHEAERVCVTTKKSEAHLILLNPSSSIVLSVASGFPLFVGLAF